jgi:hypothetical protein
VISRKMEGDDHILSNCSKNILPRNEPPIFCYFGLKAFTSEVYSIDNFDTTVTRTAVLRSDVVLVRELQQHSNLLYFRQNIEFALQHNFIHPEIYTYIHDFFSSYDEQLMDEIPILSSNSPALWRRLLLAFGLFSTWDFFKHDALRKATLATQWAAYMLAQNTHKNGNKSLRRQLNHLGDAGDQLVYLLRVVFEQIHFEQRLVSELKVGISRLERHRNMELVDLLYSIWLAKMNLEEKVCRLKHERDERPAPVERQRQIRTGHSIYLMRFNQQRPQSLAISGVELGSSRVPGYELKLVYKSSQSLVDPPAKLAAPLTLFWGPQTFGPPPTPSPRRPLPHIPQKHVALERRSDLLIANHARILLAMNKEPNWSISVEPVCSNPDSEVGNLRGIPSHQSSYGMPSRLEGERESTEENCHRAEDADRKTQDGSDMYRIKQCVRTTVAAFDDGR